jgi:CHAT domain-containing protein
LALSRASSGGNTAWDKAEVLSGEVIASLSLRGTDLVVLSVCETNRGPALIGEGTLSLQRAFLLAEVRSVVGSLWKVDDKATAELMTLFYANLWEKGLTKVEALRAAQRTMRDYYNLKDGSHRNPVGKAPLPPGNRTPPRLWAQFMLTGDWGRPRIDE